VIAQVARLCAVTVALPPLLTDFIRGVLTSRTNVERVVEMAVSPQLIERLQALDPCLVLIRETSADSSLTIATVAAALKRARVVMLSHDGRFIWEAGEQRELTADTLVGLLRERSTP